MDEDEAQVTIIGKPWDKPAAPSAILPANLPPVDDETVVQEERIGLSRAQQLEQAILEESLSYAHQALELAALAVELFDARRDTPQNHKQLLVALRNLVTEIERERLVFNRRMDA